MRIYALGDACAVGEFFQHLQDAGAGYGLILTVWTPAERQEQVVRACVDRSPSDEAVEPSRKLGPDRNQALLLTFALNLEKGAAVVPADVVGVKSAQLSHA